MKNDRENGNAIVWILIAVALFAALNYAFNSSSRTSTSLLKDAETQALDSQTQDYDNAVNSAVKRLKLRGCKDSEISYETPNGNNVNADAPSDESCHVFRANGGQVSYQGSD